MTETKRNNNAKFSTNVLEEDDYLRAHADLPVPVGRRVDTGRIFVEDLSKLPHIIISGDSGSGKTSFVQTLMAIMIKNNTPDDIGFVVFDSKYVEYSIFSETPYLEYPIIKDREELIETIETLSIVSQERLSTLSNVGLRDVGTYNDCCIQNNLKKIKRIFFILDDYSASMLGKEEFAKFLSIVSNSRISGIHVIVVTSRLSPKSIQKELLSSIPCKIAFHLSSKNDSKTFLDRNGAEELFVPGGIIYKKQNEVVECQCVYSTHDNIKSFLNGSATANSYKLQSLSNVAASYFNKRINLNSYLALNDSMFNKAVDYAVEFSEITAPFISRKLGIEHHRATRLIDEMESMNFIAKKKETNGYKVLITEDQWKKYLENEGFIYYEPNEIVLSNSLNNNESPIRLKSFPKFEIDDNSISISNDYIHIVKPVMTKLGKGNLTSSLNGESIKEIHYKEPNETGRGYFHFIAKEDVNITNRDQELLPTNKENVSQYLKIYFNKDVQNKVERLLHQISKDTGVPITFE